MALRLTAPAATDLDRGAPPYEPVHICGLATTGWAVEHDAVLDELVFDCVAAALHQAGLRKQQVGLVVTASMDIYDGRSISTGLTTPAAGGYLTDSYRIEGDAAQAIIAAAQAIRAGHVDIAIAAAVHHPEITSRTAQAHVEFLDQVSNLAFDPQFNRPVAMCTSAGLALHASKWLEDEHGDVATLAAIAASEITRGAGRASSTRNQPVGPDDVLASNPIAWPLTELMLPAYTAGAGAVVLTSAQVARRAKRSLGCIVGTGMATSNWTWDDAWLRAPESATARAASDAYRAAGFSGERTDLDVVELTAATPALLDPICEALGVEPEGQTTICPFGGARANYPGLVNGISRLSDALKWLGDKPQGGRAIVHSNDLVTGLCSQTATVMIVEAE
ncbi:Acetyl-CoA acetyltransferase [Mycobacterium sp. 283mftsu]|nr:Acetyl-CoA acetyltransferase [Mycobacterium sp. 283mftsu]